MFEFGAGVQPQQRAQKVRGRPSGRRAVAGVFGVGLGPCQVVFDGFDAGRDHGANGQAVLQRRGDAHRHHVLERVVAQLFVDVRVNAIIEYGVSSSVVPSGAAALTASTAMRAAAPVLFSTTAGFMVYAEGPSFSATRRLVVSAEPPTGKPLMILTCSRAWAQARRERNGRGQRGLHGLRQFLDQRGGKQAWGAPSWPPSTRAT